MEFSAKLVSKSSLTARQVSLLELYRNTLNGDIKSSEAASRGSYGRLRGPVKRPLTLGSYYRTVKQGRDNIKRSMVTLLLGVWLEVVRPQDVTRLMELAGQNVPFKSGDDAERLESLLDALLERVVA